MKDIALLIVRLGTGLTFAAHGLQKAFGAFGGSGISGFAGMLEGLGMHPPLVWAYAAAYAELLGGLFLMLGLIPRVSSLFLFIVMTVASFKVHAGRGFFLQQGGVEYVFILLCVLSVFMLLGSGKYSVKDKF